jgi:hypothetical protein
MVELFLAVDREMKEMRNIGGLRREPQVHKSRLRGNHGHIGRG